MAFLDQNEEEEDQFPCSAVFSEEWSNSSEFKVQWKFTLGDISTQTFCVRFDYNDKYIAASKNDGSIQIFNLFTQRQSYVLNENSESRMPCTVMRWRPIEAPGVTKNVLIATGAEGSLMHFHTTSGKLLNKIYNAKNPLLTCDYKPDGLEFLTGGEDGKIRVYDERTRKLKVELEGGGSGLPGHTNRVFCAKYVTEDPNLIVSGGWDKNVKIWDVRQNTCIQQVIGPSICGDSIDVHDGFILTGQYDQENQLQLWKIDTGELVETISFDEKLPSDKPVKLYSTQFQKNSHDLILAGGSGGHEVKVFDGDCFFEPCYRIHNLSRACYSVDFSNSGEMFAIGGGDGVVRVFEVSRQGNK